MNTYRVQFIGDWGATAPSVDQEAFTPKEAFMQAFFSQWNGHKRIRPHLPFQGAVYPEGSNILLGIYRAKESGAAWSAKRVEAGSSLEKQYLGWLEAGVGGEDE